MLLNFLLIHWFLEDGFLCFAQVLSLRHVRQLSFLLIYTVVQGAGRGAIARKDLKVGDIALEIPVSIIISEETVRETDIVCFLVAKVINSENSLFETSLRKLE